MSDETAVLVAPFVPARRWFGVFSLGMPPFLIIFLLLQGAVSSVISIVLLLGISVGFIWAAMKMAQVPAAGLTYDGERLETEDGMLIALQSEIAEVQTGLFAFRPSNGFTMLMKQPGTMPTRPGVFWRKGRAIGVGGILRASETKSIGRAIQAEIARKNEAE